jgi:glyoxylase-like metal-dependent hydrolase (beta-lactamase superfamily II)
MNGLIDLVIISHFHLDHCGSLPYFTEVMGYDGDSPARDPQTLNLHALENRSIFLIPDPPDSSQFCGRPP